MTATLFVLPRQVKMNVTGIPYAGAQAFFYQTGTQTPQLIYQDSGLTVEHPFPVLANDDGYWPVIWLDSNAAADYQVRILSANGVELDNIQNVSRGLQRTDLGLDADFLGGILYPHTASEILAGITPISYLYPAGRLDRYTVNSFPGITDMEGAWQAAINSATSTDPKIRFSNENSINQPLLVTPTSIESLVIEGDSRTTSILSPLSVDIKRAPQNVNALIINQNNNGHLQLRDMRFQSNIAYTGKVLYALEGGASDTSGQAAFSVLLDNLWVSLSSQNTGLFYGGFSNLKVNNLTVEFANLGVFILKGVGNGDQLHQNISMDFSYGGYISDVDEFGTTDANAKALITVNNLTCYEHLRGPVISLKSALNCKFSNIALEVDASNIGSTGLFKFTDCTDIQCSNCSALVRTGTVACAVGIEIINSFTGKFENIQINAVTGLKMSGTGNVDITFVACDFTECTTCWDFSGTQGGTLRFIGCRMNNAQQNAIVQSSGASTFDVEWMGGEIINAGLSNSAFSNLNIAPVGNWIFRGTAFGKNNGGTTAANWVNATAGGGSITFETPKIIGAPPTALNTGTLGVFWNYARGVVTLASAATLTLPLSGDIFLITGTTGITTITATGNVGRRFTLKFAASLTVTAGSNLKMNGNFSATVDDCLSFVCDGTTCFETARSNNA